MKSLRQPPPGNLFKWIVEKPHEVRALISRINQLSNADFFVQDANGGQSRVGFEFAKENASASLTAARQLASTGGSTGDTTDEVGGDVFGPAASVVNNIATFFDETGKRIRDSGININDIQGGFIAAGDFTSVSKSATQGIPNGSGSTAITFDTEIANPAGWFNSGAPTRFTFPASGIYVIYGFIYFDINATSLRLGWIRRNGTEIIGINGQQAVAGGLATTLPVFGFDHFAINDYIEVMAQQWSGGGLNVLSGCSLKAVRIDTSILNGGGGADLASIVCSGGDVVTSDGEVVWSTP